MGTGVDVALGLLFFGLFVVWLKTPGDPSPAALFILFAIGAWMVSVIAKEGQVDQGEDED